MDSMSVHLPPKVEQSGSVRIITFTADKFRDVENVIASELEGWTDALGDCHVLLDFTNVERISSVELGTLITLHKKMRASGGRLTMFNMKAEIYEVFTLTRLQTFMGICREDEALATAKRTP
jgi:anti-sigma B factor antagonist